jgi:acyl dehydratase
VIHGEQRFWWKRPIRVESLLSVSGVVTRIRARGGVEVVGFDLAVEEGEAALMGGNATFLVSGEAAVDPSHGEPEPPPGARAENDALIAGSRLTGIRRSASRSDLVRYAAATRDWNPIHWDHDAAVAAGLPGVVVHGLLQAAWLMSAAAGLASQPGPLVEASFRFRAPLRPNVQAAVNLAVEGDNLQARLVVEETETVAARMVLR